MTYLKYVQYFYLAFGIFFIGYAVLNFINNEEYLFTFLMGLAAIGMFFFRRKMYNKYKNNQ
jgi:hypothetical protein